MLKDSLGDRMKHNYEEVTKTRLTRRTPVIIRLDGCHFHSFTRGLKKPFDALLISAMQKTMKYLCENIQGVVLGYTQSDEITLVLVDYKKFNSQAWFDYEVQKITSVSSSLATMAFNKFFTEEVTNYLTNNTCEPQCVEIQLNNRKYEDALREKIKIGGYFDSRAFNLPKEEVANCLIWRQLDAERNSIQSVAQAHFSPKELNKLNCKNLISKLETEKHIIWGNLPASLKRGTCCIKKDNSFIIDYNIPRFIENRDYINKLIEPEEI